MMQPLQYCATGGNFGTPCPVICFQNPRRANFDQKHDLHGSDHWSVETSVRQQDLESRCMVALVEILDNVIAAEG